MKLLFIHQNFPGQYKSISAYMAGRGHEVTAIGEAAMVAQRGVIQGVQTLGYPTPAAAGEQTHHYLQSTEAAVRRGQSVARALLGMREKGYVPDIICVHPGWGEGLFLRDVYPQAPLLMFSEFYFQAQEADLSFDPEFPYSLDWSFSVRIRNSAQLISLATADACMSPTEWQLSRYPDFIRERAHVIHDGIDCTYMHADASDSLTIQPLNITGESRVVGDVRPAPGTPEHNVRGDAESVGPDGLDTGGPYDSPPITLTAKDKVITFISRNLEPYRGYHVFTRALPEIQKNNPDAHILIVGADGTSYSPSLPKGKTYKEMFLSEVRDKLDFSRIHFLGRISYKALRSLFRISSVHVYLTYPFVLSWSMLEAMACESLLLASRTAPVQEVIRDGENGMLIDFFDAKSMVQKITDALEKPEAFIPLRKEARRTVLKRFELNSCLLQQADLIQQVVANKAGK
ncbi:glycosyltransferase [Desulfovibrio sp. OttesenSCG-928-O18]|nr:glycosyltransferase [Desulfovibrio sp. OttesenSCG-928-O18]